MQGKAKARMYSTSLGTSAKRPTNPEVLEDRIDRRKSIGSCLHSSCICSCGPVECGMGCRLVHRDEPDFPTLSFTLGNLTLRL